MELDMHVPWASPCVVWKLVEVVGERLHADLFICVTNKHRCTDEYLHIRSLRAGQAKRKGATTAFTWI